MRKAANDLAEYTLVTAAEEASEFVPMTGTTVAADGWFPNLNPAATGNITSTSVKDLAYLTAKFQNENFDPEMYEGTLVLDSLFGAEFKLDEHVTNVLYKNARDVRTGFFEFDAWKVYTRSSVVGWDTTSSAIINPEKYIRTGIVQNDGTVPAYTPPVIPATTYGAGLAFMPQQIISAMGNTNIHMVSDPNSFGWKWSMDIRYGAGVMREDGVGVKVIHPTVVP